MKIEGIQYGRKREVFEVLQVTKDNYFDCLVFIAHCEAQVSELHAPLHKKLKNFQEEGIFYINKDGKLANAFQGSYLVKRANKLTAVRKKDLELFYEPLTKEEAEEFTRNKTWDYNNIDGM